jgi:AcrR family transcriptional regulator
MASSTRASSAAPPGDGDDPSGTAVAAGRPVGRPRDEALDARILAEALDEIARRGLAGFNFGAVARRAGVAKNTVYLRWRTREDLIRAALAQGRNATQPSYSWDLARDLHVLADEFASLFGTDIGLAAYYQLSVAQLNDPELWEWGMQHIIEPAHAIPEGYLLEAQRRGIARDDVDAAVIARMFVGAIYTEAILRTPHGHVSEAFRKELVAHILQVLTKAR